MSRPCSSLLLDVSKEHVLVRARNQAQLVSQLAAGGLSHWKDVRVQTILASVDRGLFARHVNFVPEMYTNTPVDIGFGASMSTPQHHALLVDTLLKETNLQKQTVLDVGCGTGYLTAVLAGLVFDGESIPTTSTGFVLGVERVPALVKLALGCLQECPISAPFTHDGKVAVTDPYKGKDGGAATWNVQEWLTRTKQQRFNIIHVGFSFESEDQAEFQTLMRDVLAHGTAQQPAIMLAGLKDDLCIWTRRREGESATRRIVHHIPGLAKMQCGEYVAPITRTARKAQLKKDLDDWVAKFMSTHDGKKPTREEMMSDAMAKILFTEFSRL